MARFYQKDRTGLRRREVLVIIDTLDDQRWLIPSHTPSDRSTNRIDPWRLNLLFCFQIPLADDLRSIQDSELTSVCGAANSKSRMWFSLHMLAFSPIAAQIERNHNHATGNLISLPWRRIESAKITQVAFFGLQKFISDINTILLPHTKFCLPAETAEQESLRVKFKWKPGILLWVKQCSHVHGCVSTFGESCWLARWQLGSKFSPANLHATQTSNGANHKKKSCINVLFCCANQPCDCCKWGHQLAPVSTG